MRKRITARLECRLHVQSSGRGIAKPACVHLKGNRYRGAGACCLEE